MSCQVQVATSSGRKSHFFINLYEIHQICMYARELVALSAASLRLAQVTVVRFPAGARPSSTETLRNYMCIDARPKGR